jgi:hypothetical protein
MLKSSVVERNRVAQETAVCLYMSGTTLVCVGCLSMVVMDCWKQLSGFCLVEQQFVIAVGQYRHESDGT